MSFIQTSDQTHLVRDTFPGSTTRLQQDSSDVHVAQPRAVVPSTFDGVAEWAFVTMNPEHTDPSRQFSLFHVPQASEDNQLFKVRVRLQGFLGEHKMAVLGNWDGTQTNACKAITFLELLPGAFPTQWTAQMNAIKDIKTLVHCALSTGESTRTDSVSDKLFLQRRVFTKINDHTNQFPSILQAADDLRGLARKIQDDWRITHKAFLGQRLDTGRVRPCSRLRFQQGDFVDVGVTFDIACLRRDNRPPVTVVHLAYDSVIQLCSADFVQQRMLNLQANPPVPTTSVSLIDAGTVADAPASTEVNASNEENNALHQENPLLGSVSLNGDTYMAVEDQL